MYEKFDPILMGRNHGISQIGAAQRVIAFASVADGGTMTINGVVTPMLLFTAAAHALTKHQYFNIAAGTYAGVRKVYKVLSANTFLTEGTFTITQASNLLLLSAKDGFGFWVDTQPVTITSLIPDDNALMDVAAFIVTPFVVGQYYHVPFKQIIISAGNIRVVRQPIKAPLAYTNR